MLDYLRRFRHRRKVAWGARGGRKSGLAGNFLLSHASASGVGAVAAARIGWIEVALLSLRIVEVSADTLVKARSSILGAIWAPDYLDLLGIVLGNNIFQKKKDSEFPPKSFNLYGGSDETRTRDLRRDRPAF